MPGPLPPAVYRRRRLTVAAGLLLVILLLMVGIGRLVDDDGESTATGPGLDPDRSTSTTAPTTTEPAVTTTTFRTTGTFVFAPGGSFPAGTGPLKRYTVEVEDGSGVDPSLFAAEVDAILLDPRGWTTRDGITLQRVPEGPADFTVRLATPDATDVLCFPLITEGEVSCGKLDMAVINLTRWNEGADPSGLDLPDYRRYVIGHEVGHVLGHHHVECPGPGLPAPLMMQQTLGIGACTPNPWPTVA